MATISDFSPEDQKAAEEGSTEKLQFFGDVLCDSCIDSPNRALKSCLTCLVSYCEAHLRPHLENAKFQNHRLVEPLHDIERPACEAHRLPLERFCLDDGSCLCPDCEREGHEGHVTAAVEEARGKIEMELQGKQAELNQGLSEVGKAMVKLQSSNESVKNLVRDVCARVEQQFTRLQKTVEEAKKLALEVLAREQKQALRQSESIQKHLEQKEGEITKVLTHTNKLLKAKSDMDFLQKYCEWKKTSADVSLPSVHVNNMEHLSSYEQTVTDTTARLCELLLSSYTENTDLFLKSGNKCKSRDPDPSSLPQPETREDFQKYQKNLTFNADTIHNFLRLTEDQRKLTNTSPWTHNYPDHPSRFEHWRQALTADSLYLGRHYVEAELKGDGAHIGVTYNSLNPKEEQKSSCVCESEYSWCIGKKSKSVSVWHAGVETPLEATDVTTVGLYLDYQKGSLSFYKVSESCLKVLHRYEVDILEPLYVVVWLSKKENSVRLLEIKK